MENQRGVIHLFLPLLLMLAAVGFLLVYFKVIKTPSIPIFQKKTNVEIKSDYSNPFKKETQYVNPFETYKNPFAVAK